MSPTAIAAPAAAGLPLGLPLGLQLRLLGSPAWREAAGPWRPLVRKDAALLARLALEGAQTRATLAAWLWPEVPAARAQANLRQRLFRLRRGAAALVVEQGVQLALGTGVHCDLCLVDADPASLLSPDELLAGLPPAKADDAVQQWLDQARASWQPRRAEALSQRAHALERAGDLDTALLLVCALVQREPLLEHAWRRLMQLHLARGDRAAALAAFERCERVLRDELGVRPSPATLALLHRAETLAAAAPAVADGGLPAVLLRPPPLVGRETERHAMAAAWATGRAFVLVGEAGMGKSRLLGAWASRQPGCAFESARPGDELVAYGTLVRLLRALQRTSTRPDALWPDAAARREMARLLPELGDAPAAPGLQALLHDAVERTLAHAPDCGVQAVLLDDLQHADDATLALLRRLLVTPGLTWGLATRPGARPDLADWLSGSGRIACIELQPLSDALMYGLLQTLDLPPALLAGLAGRSHDLARHSGGNPLFLLETLRHLALTGGVAGADPLPLPPTVQALLAERLKALTPPALALARLAAVAGADFDAEVACSVMQLDALALAEPWQALQRAQVLAGATFTHDALRVAVLAGLPQPLRAPLHAGVGACLRARGAVPQRAAHHFAVAGRWADAAAAALQAADAARRVGRTQDRLAALAQAADWADRAGDESAAFAARLAAVQSLHAQDGLAAAQQALIALQPAAITAEQQLTLHLEQAELALAAYDQPALQTAAAAAGRAATVGSIEHRLALGLQACALARSGDIAAAAAPLAQLRNLLQTEPPAVAELSSWNHLTVALHHSGRIPELLDALDTLRRLAHEAGDAEQEASALASLSGQCVALSEPERAVRDGRAAVALHRRIGTHHLAVMAELNLVVALISTHALDEALQLSASAASHLASAAAGSDLPHIVADLRADICLRLGDPAAALRELDGVAADALSPVRQLHRMALRWRAFCAQGDHAAAAAVMARMRPAVQGPAGGGVWMRAATLCALDAGPGAQADSLLAALTAAAQAAQLAAGEALAVQTALHLALQAHEPLAALTHARRLQALRSRVRHLYVDEIELVADVHTALLQASRADRPNRSALAEEAAGWRAAAQAWLAETVEPGLPTSHRGLWRARPAVVSLLGEGGRAGEGTVTP